VVESSLRLVGSPMEMSRAEIEIEGEGEGKEEIVFSRNEL